MEEDKEIPIILGRPFLAIGRAMIVRHPAESDKCFMIETLEAVVSSQSGLIEPLETSLVQSE